MPKDAWKENPKNELFFIAPDHEPELNAVRAVNKNELALYMDGDAPASEYEQNDTAWD